MIRTYADIDRDLSGAMAKLQSYTPFTERFNRIVVEEIFPNDTPLKQAFATQDQKRIVLLLEEKLEDLQQRVTPNKIIQAFPHQLHELFEKAYLVIATKEILRRCEDATETKPAKPWLGVMAGWFNTLFASLR